MKVKDLNGVEQTWIFDRGIKPPNKSKPHLDCRTLLYNSFPTMTILEEVPIKTGTQQTLYLDFYIPIKHMAVEVHGEQHYSYIPHFHKNKLEFFRAKNRDKNKEEWCKINNIHFVVLKHNETIEEWKGRLMICQI